MSRFFALALVVVSLFACQKQPEWDVEVYAPLLKSKLYIQDAIEDSLLATDDENALSLTYTSELFSFKVDSLFSIPDTSTRELFSIPVGTIQLAPGQQFVDDTIESEYSIQDIELRFAKVRSGEIQVALSSSIPEATIFTYSLPYATLNGVPFLVVESIPPGSLMNPSSISKTFDLAGYELDLRGKDFNKSNTITAIIQAEIDPNGSVTTVTGGDFVRIDNSFSEIIPEYARGYFGNRTEIEEAIDSNTFFSNIKGGTLLLEEAELTLSVINEAGIDLRIDVEELVATNTTNQQSVPLTGNIVSGTINLSRAQESAPNTLPIIPSSYSTTVDETNSNLPAFVSVLPDALEYRVALQLNPLGNTSNSNDFIYYNTGIEVKAEATVPLKFSAQNLMIVDTLEFELDGDSQEDVDPIQNGTLLTYAENYYPTDALLQCYFMDSSFVILDSLFKEPQLLSAGLVNQNGIVVNPTPTTLSTEASNNQINRLYDAQLAIIEVTLTTPPDQSPIQLYDQYHVDFQLVGDFTYRIQEL